MRRLALLSLFAIVLLSTVAPALAAPAPPVRVYYAGPGDGVQRALRLAEDDGQFELVTDPAQAEFSRAVDLSGFVRPMSRLFYAGNALGARLSPLHGRFPIDAYEPAMREAATLTQERVELVAVTR